MSDEPLGGLAGGIPLGPGGPARPPAPVPLQPPRQPQLPENVTEPVAVESVSAALVDPDRQLPPGVAKLSVHRVYDQGHEAFLLTGHSGEQAMRLDSQHTRLRPDDLALHNLRQGNDIDIPPSEVLMGLAEWSEGQQTLVCWINALRARHGEELHLVVWDDTDYDIPWELLHLPSHHEHGLAAGILGALVTVVRWTTIREVDAAPFREPASCAGHVLGYYAERMKRDSGVFGNYVHDEHIGDRLAFLTELDRLGLGAGLVYMGCHAEHGPHAHEVNIDAITWSQLNRRPMHGLSGRKTLVILNACDSARMFRNHARGEAALRGLAELFLRKGAAGCIGTSGEVGDRIAHKLTKELLGQVCAASDLPVARALRDFRAAAVAQLPDLGSSAGTDLEMDRRILWVLYSFMFLYFGHPLTTLRLSVRVPEVPA